MPKRIKSSGFDERFDRLLIADLDIDFGEEITE
jgi:hypothetical protein